ncbi:MAG: HEAT repeat domain-containing protein [Planctomycetes bacterium]|nr:HEAT repeat domain-containing protein [Planctomycetota bacterium]MBL7038531.1 HEAT repeat domain-containing protein [Pirellulaceae bacterium]
MSVQELIAGIRSEDAGTRCAAWQTAGEYGASAVIPLAAVMGESGVDQEVARAAKNGLWAVVRSAWPPGTDAADGSVVSALIELLKGEQPVAVRREALWMLSEIGGAESVEAIAGLVTNGQLREDARCALERIPGEKSLDALKQAFDAAAEDFKSNLAQSLRARGETVDGVPCRKLTPVYKTKADGE